MSKLNYATSKAANWLLADEAAKRILSVVQNPGNLDTHISQTILMRFILRWLVLYSPELGAYTELYAGLSPEITEETEIEIIIL